MYCVLKNRKYLVTSHSQLMPSVVQPYLNKATKFNVAIIPVLPAYMSSYIRSFINIYSYEHTSVHQNGINILHMHLRFTEHSGNETPCTHEPSKAMLSILS